MTSFSHPLMILSKSLAPALATGNSVVIKASERMPLTTVLTAAPCCDTAFRFNAVNLRMVWLEQCATVIRQNTRWQYKEPGDDRFCGLAMVEQSTVSPDASQ
jgi:hypothetical protein